MQRAGRRKKQKASFNNTKLIPVTETGRRRKTEGAGLSKSKSTEETRELNREQNRNEEHKQEH